MSGANGESDAAVHDAAAAGAAQVEGATAGSIWAKYNTAEKKARLVEKRAREHEASIEKRVRQCHRLYAQGHYGDIGPRPGKPLPMKLPVGGDALMYSLDQAAWVPVVLLRVIKTRKDGQPDMVAATRDGECLAAPLSCVRSKGEGQ